MTLSAPIYRLKRKARLLSREVNIPLHEALDRVAVEEGFGSWSLLMAKTPSPAARLFMELSPGDLVLLGARPGQGKTLLSLELAAEAMKAGYRAVFFSLEYTKRDVPEGLEFDGSDLICADYIVEKLASAPRGTLVVVDYLQILDQRRENPELAVQIRTLRAFAQERGLIVVFVSQVDRAYDPVKKPCPDLRDVRLPNPLDLKQFHKTCFLNDGIVQMKTAI